MSEIVGQTGHPGGRAVVHEAYSFACMRCGHGWEQAYEIEHHVDADGREFVIYMADGQCRAVPADPARLSELRRARGAHHAAPGQVASAVTQRPSQHRPHRRRRR